MKKIAFILCLFILVSCSQDPKKQEKENQKTRKPFEVTIDWVPSPEYYGFFVAKQEGLYKEIGLDVTIKYGSGAPVVANLIASNSIYAGTTTSDNILRQVAMGGEFYKIFPILNFNPTVLVSLKSNPIGNMTGINNKMIGVNKQSSAYQQFQYIVNNNPKIQKNSIKEFPIGWGGAAQLESNQVDAFLAYATNAAIDLKVKNIEFTEIFFSDQGVHLYGLVLAFASKEAFQANNITEEDVQKFAKATIAGYKLGGENVELAINSLMKAEPTLDKKKIELAVKRIHELNSEKPTDFEKLDEWVSAAEITKGVREKTLLLYK